jgi:hypothetical protein
MHSELFETISRCLLKPIKQGHILCLRFAGQLRCTETNNNKGMAMKQLHRLIFTLCNLLFASFSANATLVTWNLQGHLTTAFNIPSDLQLGTPFSIQLQFDTGAALLGQAAGDTGWRYRFDPSSLVFKLYSGTTCNPCRWATSDPGNVGTLFVRDNYSLAPGFPAPIDGFTFAITQPDNTLFQIIMRGPILDLINGPVLPANPDPHLASYQMPGFEALFLICGQAPACNEFAAGGAIESVSRVPEPTAPALLVLGAGALLLARRQRTRRAVA